MERTKRAILVVDDDFSLCKTMFLILKRNGYAVTTAMDGLEAVDRVRERPFDIIFMDIKMHIMDGVEAYRRIRQIRPGLVVLMMTGHAVKDLVEEALQEGAYDVLYKPLDMEKVLRMVDEILERKQKGVISLTPPERSWKQSLSRFGLYSYKDS